MENIIILSGGKQYFANSFEEVVKMFFGKDYFSKSFEEKYKIRYQKGLGISIKDGLDLVDTRVGKLGGSGKIVSKEYNFSKSFIIDNEKTFIISLCKFEDVIIMEEKNSHEFNVDSLMKYTGDNNYSVINKYCNELLLLNLKKML